jgi:beta-lactamase class A
MKRLILISLLFLLAAHPASPATDEPLQERVTQLAAAAPATVGVAAIDLESGRQISVRGDERFPMGSVFKFPVALAFLERVDHGDFALSARVTIDPSDFAPGYSPIRDNAHGKPVTLTYEEILVANLGASDNTAADFLLKQLGGPAAVTKRLRDLEVIDIDVNRSERTMTADLHRKGGVAQYAIDRRDTATPDAAVELLQRFHAGKDGLSPASHALALKAMTESQTGPRRIRAALPAGASLAHKTGTMPGTLNDIGIITSPDGKHHILLAVFTKAATTKDEAPRDKVVEEIARAVYEEFAK